MKIVIVGAVAAGMSAAGKISRHGEGVHHVVYEKRSYSSLGACGIPFYVGGHINDSQGLIARTNEEHIKAGINLKVLHEVIEIKSKEKVVVVKNLQTEETFEDEYDKLILATGASAIVPPIPGIKDFENIFTATTLGDAQKIYKAARTGEIQKVAVIGGGFIGVEMAESLTSLGKDVRLIEAAPRPSGKAFDPEITNVLVEELKNHTHLHLNEKVSAFKGTGILKKVVTDKGEYDADMAIVAIGFKPNANIECDAEFIRLSNGAYVVDDNMRTSVKDIYAIGDCATINDKITGERMWIPLATTARKTGKYVGDLLLGNETGNFVGTIGTSGFKFHDIELFRTGLTEQQAVDLNIEIKVTYLQHSDHASYVKGMKPLHGKIIVEEKTGRIIGAQFAGQNGAAAMRISAMGALIWKGTTDKELIDFDFTYTPPFSKPTDLIHLLGSISYKSRNK